MPLKRRKAAAVSDSRVRGPKRAKTNDPDSSSEQEFVNESRNSSTKKLTRSQRREREEEQTKQESIHEEQKSEIVNSSRSKAKRRCRSNGYVDILENSSNKDEFSTRNERAIPQKAKGQTHSRKGRCNEDATSARDSSDVQAVTKVDLPEEDEVINQSSSESEWEEVQDGNPETDEDDREPVIPKEGVQITIDLPESQGKRRNKKEFDIAAYFRRVANRLRKELREGIHKVHLLCLLASGFWIEGALGNNIVKAFALSLIPQELIIIDQGQAKKESLTKLLDWFRREFKLDANQKRAESLSTDVHYIIQGFQEHQTCSKTVYVCMLLACIRTAGYNARFVWSFQPCPYKAPLVEAKSSGKLKSDNVKTTLDVASTSPVGAQVQGTQKRKKSVSSTIDDTYNSLKKETVEPLAVNDIDVVVKNSRNDKMGDGRQRRSLRCSQRSKVDYSEDKNDESDLEIVECQDSKKRNSKNKTCSKKPKEKQADLDDDFEVVTVEVRKPRPVTGLKRNRKALSSDDDSEVRRSCEGNDQWIEVYAQWTQSWICIDCTANLISNLHDIEDGASKPMLYVMAFEGVTHVKDITRRYASGWLSYTRKLRVDIPWWDETLEPFRMSHSERDRLEDEQLHDQLLERPMPKTISEYKNHPLYALKRHLLKFECIYPPEAVPVSYIRGEPVYSRECVRTLHSRETWLKQARTVKIGETPYKVVKSRPKWIPATREIKTDIPLEIFGEWQTEEYVPPIARDGKVPRNEYGNVDMFQSCMLPKGTVHLQVPGLHRIAKKLNIDCAPAMIGWDFRGWGSHPTFDGFVVCEEFKDTLMDAWTEEQAISQQRENEKKEKRVYGNWRRLIRGLLIRERLRIKYSTESKSGEPSSDPEVSTKGQSRGKKAKCRTKK